MRLVTDCESCGSPAPAGRRCPHCGQGPKAGSLRGFVLRFALLGIAACSAPIGVLYGIAICNIDAGGCPENPCFDHSLGQVCSCSGTQTCTCSDAGICAPHVDVAPDGGTDGG